MRDPSTALAFLLSFGTAALIVWLTLPPIEDANAAVGEELSTVQCSGYVMLHVRFGSARQAEDFAQHGPCRFAVVPASAN